ncbi:MAG TPA: hypothetical protein DCL44_11420 [Elusimicrobia bacterium]|nr:hypothetical protein [Elusimicrobiota bacterium]
MAGHRAWNRFNNSGVAWNHCGYGFRKDDSEDREASKWDRELAARTLLKIEARKAAVKFTRDVPINTIGIYWAR